MEATNKLSEDIILELIHSYFKNDSADLILGRGDDCALLDVDLSNSYIAVTTDIFLEDSHFKTSYFSPEAIGYKALAVNISDIYSMGGKPHNAQFALTIPKDISIEFLERSLSSMAKLMKEHNIILSGGDLTKSDKISFTISLMGLVDKEVKLIRNQAKVDDIVFLVGDIGLSHLALNLLEENTANTNNYPKSLNAHFFPTMHKESALAIATFVKEHKDYNFSLMDVSDGLAQDLPRLVQAYGVDITMEFEDVHEEIRTFCNNDIEKSIQLAIKGGEDYALVGTCPAILFEEFIKSCPQAKAIGRVKPEKGLSYFGKTLNISGYDHFKK